VQPTFLKVTIGVSARVYIMENMQSEEQVGHRLKLSGGVPKYPIVNKSFNIELSIVDEVDQVKYDHVEVPLLFRALWEGILLN
jgi:hypothetical protein